MGEKYYNLILMAALAELHFRDHGAAPMSQTTFCFIIVVVVLADLCKAKTPLA